MVGSGHSEAARLQTFYDLSIQPIVCGEAPDQDHILANLVRSFEVGI